jgi:hypothetical protein
MLYDLVRPDALDNAIAILHCLKRLRRKWFLNGDDLGAISASGFKPGDD